MSAELLPDRSGFVGPDGRRFFWEYFGPGGREVVCLLNGLAMQTQSWYSVLPELTSEWDVLLYDYLGQGRSSSDDVPVTIPELAEGLIHIADAIGLRQFHALGVSYGGFVALELARLHPDRLHTLTVSGVLLSHEELFRMYQELSLLFYRSGPQAFEIYTHYMYEKIFGEAFVTRAKHSLEKMRKSFHDRYRDRVHSLIRLTEAQDPVFAALDANLPAYAAIRTPTLVLAGEEDRVMSPRVQRKITDVIPGARFEVVPASGHVVYLERPDFFWPMLRSFLRAKSTNF